MNNYTITDDKVIFDCGCSFGRKGKKVIFSADLHNPHHTINFDCKETYRILCEGLTQGVFQLCSPLGTQWTRKVQPSTLEHISALGAILRPGCLESKDSKGNSITVHYERRKNGKEETPPYHPVVDEVLKDSFGCLIYQEQAMAIAVKCAGFSLQDADSLRKAIGKKIPEEMAKSKKIFMEKGREAAILSESQLVEVFHWIEASQRYSFNHSHSMCYGVIGYVSAYEKAHFPLQFYKEFLRLTDKREDYVGFINEAKLFNIDVKVPDLRHMKPEFYSRGGNIYFGLNNIKGILKKDLEKIISILTEKNIDLASLTWIEFLRNILEEVSSKTAEGLINSGALDYFHINRNKLAYDYERWNRLSPKEKDTPFTACKSVLDCVRTLQVCMESDYQWAMDKYKEKVEKRKGSTRTYKTVLEKPNENRRLPKVREIRQELEEPVYTIVDTVDSIIFAEENLLGFALTRHKTDEIALAVETATCLEIANGQQGYAVLKVKIDSARPYKTKNDSGTMCFMEVSDRTSRISALAFNKSYVEYQHLLTQGNLVFVSGRLGDRGSFIVERAYPIA